MAVCVSANVLSRKSLCVRNYRRQGIGAKLIQDLIRMGKESSYRRTAIDISAARSFYDKFVAMNDFVHCRLFLSE